MNVQIIETKSGKVVATIPVNLRGLNYEPTEGEFFEEAWRCAVDDRAVDENDRADYTFRLVHPHDR
jgi:hypothetical protein